MPDFLNAIGRQSAIRAARAREREPERVLLRRCADLPLPPPLVRSAAGFDLIAEVKRRSPSGGILMREGIAATPDDVPAEVVAQAAAYIAGGAAAISVLTEPEHFAGSLAHLAAIAAAVPVPAMRKDFLVDPYQVLEARAAGAGGVLLIVRLLSSAQLSEMIDAGLEQRIFLLLECFDEADIERAARAVAHLVDPAAPVLLGLNIRDLTTFALDPDRLERLRPHFPPGFPRVAESGLATPADARRAASLGYAYGLAGTALMRAEDPAQTVAALIEAGRSSGVAR